MNVEHIADGQTIKMKWVAGKFLKPVEITCKGDRLWLSFGFSKIIMAEIKKCMVGCKWHGYESPPVKQWSIKNCPHNWFQMKYLACLNPYEDYDKPLIPVKVAQEHPDPNDLRKKYEITLPNGYVHTTRWLYAHQAETVAFIITRHYCVLAEEMGSGKTLAAMEAMEALAAAYGLKDWLWVAPRSALHSVELEFINWQSPIKPTFVTCSGLKKYFEDWPASKPVHQGMILDESSRYKNPVSQRSVAAQYGADAVRQEWGPDGFVVEMSGSPAPKSPVDWYSQSEIACPGFLKEGHVNIFKDNLGIIHKRESATGGVYPQLVSWLDDERKCGVCGEFADHAYHDVFSIIEDDADCPFHAYKPSVNEVARLSKRLDGLVLVKFKKDCLDLPIKQYRRLYVEPSKSILRAAKIIASKASSTIKALTLLRQLSDGFQYQETEVGKETCPTCKGRRTIDQPIYIGPEKTWDFLASIQAVPTWLDINDTDAHPDDIIIDPVQHANFYRFEEGACPQCSGSGEITKYERSTHQVECPKDDIVRDLLDQHDDVGRFVIFGGFTGTVDHCCELVKECGWEYIRVDGRGWYSTIGGNALGMLEAFQKYQNQFPKIAFIGQPGAAGMGLTLTASPSILYYSNDFNAESRIQSEDRIHRPGMDKGRGATIYDLIHLPTDEYVLENLLKKRKLQDMTLGELGEVLKEVEV